MNSMTQWYVAERWVTTNRVDIKFVFRNYTAAKVTRQVASFHLDNHEGERMWKKFKKKAQKQKLDVRLVTRVPEGLIEGWESFKPRTA